MKKVRTTFYLNKEFAKLLRDYSYQKHKPMSTLVEEAIKLLKKEYNNGKSTNQNGDKNLEQ